MRAVASTLGLGPKPTPSVRCSKLAPMFTGLLRAEHTPSSLSVSLSLYLFLSFFLSLRVSLSLSLSPLRESYIDICMFVCIYIFMYTYKYNPDNTLIYPPNLYMPM